MTCVHLKKLYALCEKEQLKLGGADLVRIVCTQCGEQEVCPSMLLEEYEAQHRTTPLHPAPRRSRQPPSSFTVAWKTVPPDAGLLHFAA